MLGWNISIHRQQDDRLTPAARDAERGERLAVWQAGVYGLGWVDDLVAEGTAVSLGGNGYPYLQGLLQVWLTVVMGCSCCQFGRSGAEGEFVFDGREFPECSLTSPPVVGVLDPGDDLVAELIAGAPASTVQHVLL